MAYTVRTLTLLSSPRGPSIFTPPSLVAGSRAFDSNHLCKQPIFESRKVVSSLGKIFFFYLIVLLPPTAMLQRAKETAFGSTSLDKAKPLLNSMPPEGDDCATGSPWGGFGCQAVVTDLPGSNYFLLTSNRWSPGSLSPNLINPSLSFHSPTGEGKESSQHKYRVSQKIYTDSE